jgi:hypothetical protein
MDEMITKGVFALSICFFLVMGGCIQFEDGNNTSSSGFALDEEFQLRVNQSVIIGSEDLNITFLNVTEDSRCPSDVVCKWQGAVSVVVNVAKGDVNVGNMSIRLIVGYEEEANATFDGFIIRLIKVDPYPDTYKVTIEMSDYIGTFLISEI